MAFVQAVADDGTLLVDSKGNKIMIPAPFVRDDKDSSEVTGNNELNAWEKMTLDQKKAYQSYLYDC